MHIETSKLKLRAVEAMDAEFLASLINDPEVMRPTGSYTLIGPVSNYAEAGWISRLPNMRNEVHMIVELKRDGAPIGIISVKNIDDRNSSAHLGILLRRESWDQGHGTDAVTALSDHLFDTLNIHRVWMRVDEGNARAIRCYEKCGFAFEGVLREDHWKDGGWKNSLIMSKLSSDRGKKR